MLTLNVHCEVPPDRHVRLTFPDTIQPGQYEIVVVLDNDAVSDWRLLDPSRDLAHLLSSPPMKEDGVAYQRRIRDEEWS